MKLLLVVRWPVGGIRTYINYVFSKWADTDLSIDLIVPNLPESDMILQGQSDICVRYHKTISGTPGLFEFALKVHSVTKQYKFDMIHVHGFTSGVTVAWKLPFLRTPAILTSHDVLNSSQFGGVKGTSKSILLPLLFNRFSAIQSVSSDAQNNLLKTLPAVSPEKCTVIQNGIETTKFTQSTAYDLRQELNIRNETRILGFFGRFMSQKGFKYLVDAAEELEERYPGSYRVVCFGGGGFIREEKYNLKQRQLDHLFYFYDFIPDIAPFVKACDVVVAPSLWEACPLLPMEVLCSGTPLVASKCIGQREVCANTPAIMIEPGSSDSLVNGILTALECSPDTFKDFVSTAAARFDITATRNEVRELYLRVLK